MSLEKYKKLLSRQSGLESTGFEGALELSSAAAGDILDKTHDQLKRINRPIGVSRDDFDAARRRLMKAAPQALDLVAQNQPEHTYEDEHRFALEAIVRADGSRNTFYVNDNTIDTDFYADDLAEWRTRTNRALPSITEAAKSVGRIDKGETDITHVGTCFAISQNHVATNLHVLQELADREAGGAWGEWEPVDRAFVNFQGEQDNPGQHSFEIIRVVQAGPRDIGGEANPDRLDLAVLEVKPITDTPFPRAMSLDAVGVTPIDGSPVTIEKERKLYVIGFPMNPLSAPFVNDVLLVFGGEFGVKQWAPGEILDLPGTHAKDSCEWMFTHDASTLGGNSGSLIMDFQDTDNPVAMGLHFGGWARKENRAHVLAELREYLAPFGANYRTPNT